MPNSTCRVPGCANIQTVLGLGKFVLCKAQLLMVVSVAGHGLWYHSPTTELAIEVLAGSFYLTVSSDNLA